jgi:tetratricopeptide (TPR) repeat protein
MAMGAVGVNLSLDTLRQEVFLPARGGSLQVEMLAAPRRHGLVSTLLPSDMTDLLQEVAAGHPVVVLLNLALDIYPVCAYAVITGYDLPAHEVILHSGKDPDMHMVLATFEHTWSRAGRWAFVALPPDRLPRTATQAEVERAAVAFEQASDAAHAQVAYHTALQAWPDNLVLQLGWGNTLFALGQTTEAAGAFEAAARQHDSAAAWNNLANARLKLHQREAALRAADKAVERARASEPQMLDAALATQAEVRASAP